MLFLCGRRAAVKLERGGLQSGRCGEKNTWLLGFTPFAIIAIDNVMVIAMNAVLQRYGGASRWAIRLVDRARSSLQSFMLVMTMPLGGISGGTQSILSYNYGARQFDRVRARAEKDSRAVHGLHGDHVCAGARGRAAVRAAVHAGRSDGGGAVRLGHPRVYAGGWFPWARSMKSWTGSRRMGQVRNFAWPLSFWRQGSVFRRAVYSARMLRREGGVLCRTGQRYCRPAGVGDCV